MPLCRVELRLDFCSYAAARLACERWHYSRTIPTSKANVIGVWEDKAFKGAIIFGLGASPSLGKPYGIGIFEVAELVRVALDCHVTPVSRMISIATRMVHRKNPGLRLIVSFADQMHNHHGGIYQAAGWVYSGASHPSTIWKLPDGTLVDPRRYNGHGFNTPRNRPFSAVLVRSPGKHRYLFPLDKAMRDQILPLSRPYPKRAKQATDGHPPSGGGAEPTRALQN